MDKFFTFVNEHKTKITGSIGVITSLGVMYQQGVNKFNLAMAVFSALVTIIGIWNSATAS
jgi:hypothetical protein